MTSRPWSRRGAARATATAATLALGLWLGGCERPAATEATWLTPAARPDPASLAWQYLKPHDGPLGLSPHEMGLQAVAISAPNPHGNRAILRVQPGLPSTPGVPVVTLGATHGLDCPETSCVVHVHLGERYAHRFGLEAQPRSRELLLPGADARLLDVLRRGGTLDLSVSHQGASRGHFRFRLKQGLVWPARYREPAPAPPT